MDGCIKCDVVEDGGLAPGVSVADSVQYSSGVGVLCGTSETDQEMVMS